MSDDADLNDARSLAIEEGAQQPSRIAENLRRRTSARLEARDNGAVTVHDVSYVVEICNVSRHGAQIRVRHGLVPFVGQAVVLQFVNGKSIESRVVWERDTLIGLSFDEPLSDVTDGVYFDDLGSDYFRAVLKLRILRG